MTKIYLDLPPDIQLLLEENRVSIEEELANLGIDQQVTYEVPPYHEEGVRTKELITVIIVASAAAVVAVSYGISRILETLQRKPCLVEILVPEEVRDASGNVLLDDAGQPVYKMVKKYELLEPRKEDRKGDIEFHFDMKDGVVLKVHSEETQLPGEDAKEAGNAGKNKKSK